MSQFKVHHGLESFLPHWASSYVHNYDVKTYNHADEAKIYMYDSVSLRWSCLFKVFCCELS
jgi:hypothetical protein